MNKFIKGDKVFTEINGKGVIERIDEQVNTYPVEVYFENGDTSTFTVEGRFVEEDISPSLHHEGTQIIEFVPERNPEIVVESE